VTRQDRIRAIEARSGDKPTSRVMSPRDEAIERVGRALYGKHWIGEQEAGESRIGKIYGKAGIPLTLPKQAKSAAERARACFRHHASDLQFGMVFRWLRELGVDFSPEAFKPRDFERWFHATFPEEVQPSLRRKQAVREALESGQKPGRGGNIVWDDFCENVRERTGVGWDDRTIKRDVGDLTKPK
jgi:hypothetical protein